MLNIASIATMDLDSSFEFVADAGRFVKAARLPRDGWVISQRAENGDCVQAVSVNANPDDQGKPWIVLGLVDDEFVELDETRSADAAISSAMAYVLA